MTERQSRIYIAILFILLAFAFFLFAEIAGATTVTGTVKQAGTPLTGTVDIGLVYPGTNGQAVLLPGAQRLRVTNGQFPAITLDGNDTILPRGTYYQVAYRDQYGALLARSNYVITGASFDIGTAVPTPITPANINYLDLLGIRNLSAQNLTLSQSFSFANGATYASRGVTGQKVVGDVRFASGFLTGSTTCGIAEAQSDLPTAGGTIVLAAGACTLTSTVTITKPVTLTGVGPGGPTNAASTTFQSPTLLIAAHPSGSLFTIVPSVSSLAGVTFSNFAVQGNLVASPLIALSPNVSNATFTNLLIFSHANAAFAIGPGVSQVYFTGVQSIGNQTGFSLTGSGAATTGVYFTGVTAANNTADGLTVSGTSATRVFIANSVFTNNTGNGVTVASGSVNAQLVMTGSIATSNISSGLYIADGTGHQVSGNDFRPGAHQQWGVNLSALPAGPASTVQINLTGNYLASNSVADFTTSAASTNIIFFPQSVDRTSPLYHESIGNPAALRYPAFTITQVCSGTTPPWSCYRVNSDGSIDMYGVSAAAATGADTAAVSITFPIAFTSSAIELTLTSDGCADTCSAKNPTTLTMVDGTLTTTGVSAQFTGAVPVGGGGSVLNHALHAHWQAHGH